MVGDKREQVLVCICDRSEGLPQRKAALDVGELWSATCVWLCIKEWAIKAFLLRLLACIVDKEQWDQDSAHGKPRAGDAIVESYRITS